MDFALPPGLTAYLAELGAFASERDGRRTAIQ
jgi:hypothetical protein